MTTSKHTTVIEVEASQAIATENKMQAATVARIEASKRLATLLDDAEKARIATLTQSENAAKQAAGARREDIRLAKQAITAAKEEEAAIKATVAAEKQREAAIRRTEAAAAAAAIPAKKAAVAIAEIAAPTSGFLNLSAGIGSIVTGLGTLAAGAERAVRIADEAATQSLRAQQVGANLQVSIGGARDAFKGYVDDIELARIANMAFELGVVKTGDELTALAKGVQAKSERLGVGATELFDNAVTGIGRGSALILDNLGIILDQAKAEEIYAEALGKTVDELTAYEEAQSFAKAATIEISKAGEEATVTVDGLASSWRQAAVDVTNFKSALYGFDDDLGTLRENLRELDAEQLAKLATGGVGDLQASMRAQQALAKGAQQRLETEAKVAQEQAKQLRIEERRILAQASTTQSVEVEASLREEAAAVGAQAVAAEELATGRLALAREEAANAAKADAGQWTDMLEAAADIEGSWASSHENRMKAGEALRREASTALAHSKKEEIAATKATAEAEKIAIASTAAEEVASKEFEIRMAEARNAKESEVIPLQLESLRLRQEAAVAAGDEAEALRLARDYVVLEEQAANRKRGGGKRRDPNEVLDRETGATLRLLDARTTLYAAERENERDLEQAAAQRFYLLELAREELEVRERAADARKVRGADEIDELAGERLAITTERRILDLEAQTLAAEEDERIAEARLSAFDREIERLQSLGVATQLLEQIRSEARIAFAEKYSATEDVLQVKHDEAIAAIERQSDLEAKLAADREAQHKRELARIEEQTKRRQAAMNATSNLLGQGAQIFSLVAERAIKDEAKREKASLRARGVEAVARGALETVESVAAFASFNYIQGALHAVAAGVAFATGISMIAGKIPDKAGATATGGGAGHQTVVSQPESSGGSGSSTSTSGSPTTPVSAEALIMRQRQGSTLQTTQGKGATVINFNGPFIAGDSGTLLHDMSKQTLKKWGTK
jgi:hypothetical protein